MRMSTPPDVPPPFPWEQPPPLPGQARPAAASQEPFIPVTPPSVAPVPASPFASPGPVLGGQPGQDWWIWVLGALVLSFLLFCMCYSCNPATTAAENVWGKVQAGIASAIDPDLHPFLSFFMGFLFNKLFAVQYAQLKAMGLVLGFALFVVIPLGLSATSALLSHPVFMIGGAPGGWRATWKSFALHRVVCDGATVVLLILALALPASPGLGGSLLLFFLPVIRVASLVYLWIALAKAHAFGAMRIVFFAIPHVLISAFFSCALACLAALWFYGYLIARSF